MSFAQLAWAFGFAVAIHNFEEALYLPAWSRSAGRWHVPVGAFEFRFAVLILTLAALACVGLAVSGAAIGDYLLCGYALAMALNAFVPHLAATILMRSYAPGTATGLLLNLPIASALIARAFAEGRLQLATFAWSAPLTIVAILASIPALFRIGRGLAATMRARPL